MKEVEIEAFLAVIEQGSLSAAANALFITQSALSRRISSLENELGFTLFIRNKGVRNIDITKEGRAFIDVAQRWHKLFIESKTLVNNLDHREDFNMAIIGSMSPYLFPSTIKDFILSHPECKLNIHQYHSDECYYYMEKGLLDLALIGRDKYSKNINTMPLYSAPFKLLCAKRSSEGSVNPSELDPAKEILVPWNNQFQYWHDYWFGSSKKPRVWLDMMSLLEYFITDQDTWVIAPSYMTEYLAAKLNLATYALTAPPPPMTIFAIYPKNSNSFYTAEFLKLVQEHLKLNRNLDRSL